MTILSNHLLKDILVDSTTELTYGLNFYSCAGFCVEINFKLIWINSKCIIAGKYDISVFSFARN
jgi:hypothetical protein